MYLYIKYLYIFLPKESKKSYITMIRIVEEKIFLISRGIYINVCLSVLSVPFAFIYHSSDWNETLVNCRAQAGKVPVKKICEKLKFSGIDTEAL